MKTTSEVSTPKVPVPVFIVCAIILAAVCILLSGCANLPFARTYSLSYSDGKQSVGGSARFEPAPINYRVLKHDGKTIVPPEIPENENEVQRAVREAGAPRQIVDPVHGPNFGPHPVHGTADPSTYLPEAR